MGSGVLMSTSFKPRKRPCKGKDLARASHSESMLPKPGPSKVPKWGSVNQHPQPKEVFGIAMVTGWRTLSNLLHWVDAVQTAGREMVPPVSSSSGFLVRRLSSSLV